MRLAAVRRVATEVQERQGRLFVGGPHEARGRFHQHHLERGADGARHQVAGERSAVPPPEDDVGVDPRGAVLPRHVPGHRRDLDRLVDGDVLVGPGVPIEERDHGLAEGADRAEARGRQILLLGERGERADHLVTDIEDEREHALAPVPQQLRPHRTALLPQVAPQATMLMVIGKPVCGMAYTATPLTRATRRMRARRRPEAPTLSAWTRSFPSTSGSRWRRR